MTQREVNGIIQSSKMVAEGGWTWEVRRITPGARRGWEPVLGWGTRLGVGGVGAAARAQVVGAGRVGRRRAMGGVGTPVWAGEAVLRCGLGRVGGRRHGGTRPMTSRAVGEGDARGERTVVSWAQRGGLCEDRVAPAAATGRRGGDCHRRCGVAPGGWLRTSGSSGTGRARKPGRSDDRRAAGRGAIRSRGGPGRSEPGADPGGQLGGPGRQQRRR